MAHIDDSETHRANPAFTGSSMRTPLLERDDEPSSVRSRHDRPRVTIADVFFSPAE